MKIISAYYGGVDCLNQISNKVKNNKLVVRSDNDIIGDPSIGVVKYLEISILNEGEIINKKVKEGDLLVYPETTHERLGIWYSNDQANHPAVRASVKSLSNISKNVDIITCPWFPIKDNPFYEVISWYRSSSHLNQLLQILQCLSVANSMGKYKYVSFLEHDVMYPEGYFDYPEFEKGCVITNTNFGGINKNGWQNKNQQDQPMHQMTMHVEDAMEHFFRILPNALVTNNGLIEDQLFKRLTWQSKNQAIHINHGSHFTSHYSIYDTSNTYKTHPYWGEHKNFEYLFL